MPRLKVTRSEVIAKPRAEVFKEVRTFNRWEAWSPWLICEEGCSVEYAEDGKSYSWDGKIIGSGTMEITGEQEGEWITYRLNFLKPWKSVSDVRFNFTDDGEGTKVSWSMDGPFPWFLFFLKKMMEGLVGMDYERGLKMLKDQLENGNIPSRLEISGVSEIQGFRYLGIKNECSMDDLEKVMAIDFAKLKEKGLTENGPAFSQYHKWDFGKRLVRYTIGIPTDDKADDLVSGEMPSCQVFKVRHTGNYRHLGNAWSAGVFHGRAKVFKQSRAIHPFEIYEVEPGEGVPDDATVTVVCFPVKGGVVATDPGPHAGG